MALKSWCECREVDHVFGLARNPRLVRESAIELGPARATSKETGKPAKCFEEFATGPWIAGAASDVSSARRNNWQVTMASRA